MRILMLSNECGPAVRLQIDGLQRLGIDVVPVILDRAGLGRWAYCRTRRLLREQLDAVKPDIVHVQFGGVQAALAALIAPERCVVTYHGTDLHGGTRTTSVFAAVSQRVGVWCSAFAVSRTAYSIVVSESLLSYLSSSSERVCVITTGVDYEHFKSIDRIACATELGLDPKTKWVLFCDQNHDPVKRRDLAESACSRLRDLGCRASLLTLHNVNHDRVPLYLNVAEALLVTSDKEGSPNIVKEALACNTPVISVDVGDVAARIGGLDGCEICPRDPEALARALSHVLARSIRPNIREIVRPQIDNTIVCQQIRRVYEVVYEQNVARARNGKCESRG
jgi:teichuronic acid biosynthesis glycosyltransferase TuaC